MTSFIGLVIFIISVSLTQCVRPVIGILANLEPDWDDNPIKSKVYSSYVRWLEAAGAKAIVIQPWITNQELNDLFKEVNGFLFQGGGRNLNLTAPWEKLARNILNKVITENLRGNFIPLWGTCQGFELIHALIAGNKSVLTKFDAYNIATPLIFEDKELKESRMFKFFNDKDLISLKSQNTTAQFHHLGVSSKAYDTFPILNNYFRITSFSKGLDDNISIATIEAKHLPIYALQFHPEKLPYDRKPSDAIPQFGNAIKISQNFALFFVEEARRNANVFPINDMSLYDYIDTYKLKASLVNGIYYYFYNKPGLNPL
jgi:gamma-glutamyl hydrolase